MSLLISLLLVSFSRKSRKWYLIWTPHCGCNTAFLTENLFSNHNNHIPLLNTNVLWQYYFQVFQFEASKRNICIAVHEKVIHLCNHLECICDTFSPKFEGAVTSGWRKIQADHHKPFGEKCSGYCSFYQGRWCKVTHFHIHIIILKTIHIIIILKRIIITIIIIIIIILDSIWSRNVRAIVLFMRAAGICDILVVVWVDLSWCRVEQKLTTMFFAELCLSWCVIVKNSCGSW